MSRSTVTPAIIVRSLLSVLILIGYGLIVFRFISGTVQYTTEVREPLMFLLGTMTTSVGAIVGYWFGSSQGSAEKSAEISKAPPPSMTIGGNTTNNNAKDTP